MSVENTVAEEQHLERPPLAELARKVLLASIGAVALVQEEAESFIHKLIEKGEITEKDGVGILKDFREKRKKKAEEEFDKRISSLIERMDIPTKSDIEALSNKVAELSEKLDKK
jgi:polyhydroxyalkanoate synthesis regulator phasin